MCERAEDGVGTGMQGVCIGHEMGNPHKKRCLFSPKTHELFGQLDN